MRNIKYHVYLTSEEKRLLVFERLFAGSVTDSTLESDVPIAIHEDINDTDQTINIPVIPFNPPHSGVDDHMKVYITDESKCDDIRKWLSETTHLSESAFDVVYIEAIPKNEAGKVLYKDLP